jgi:ribonuclease HI
VSSGLAHLDPSEGLGLFTDGSASTKDRSGGWAYVIIDAFDGEHHASGGASDTTISRMELSAWIKGLDCIYDCFGPSTIVVWSDSEYVGLGAMDRTRKRNKNVDLWDELDMIIDNHLYVEFRHVKGHNGDVFNEMCDKLAGEARVAHQAAVD